MPPDVPVRKTFLWTYLGLAIGGAWMMIARTILAAWAGSNFDGTGVAELDHVGDHVFTGFGAIVLILASLGLVSVTALNMYGGSLTLISAVDSFKKIRPTLSVRVATITFTVAALYYLFSRSLDVEAERRVADAEAADLERTA
jgi:purine-cytosine permease-like protein